MTHPSAASVEERVPCDGALVRVRACGAGPAVVLAHGWALDLEVWTPQVQALRDAFRVVCFDRPGYGDSDGVPSPDADVAAIAAVATRVGLGRFVLVASSQAARGALRYALRESRTLAGLVLDGAPLEGFVPGPRTEHAAPVAELAALLRTDGIAAVRARLAADPFFRLRTAGPEHRALLERVLSRYAARDLASPSPPEPPVNVAARLAELGMPALVVNGEHDSPHRLLTGDALAYGLPHARRVVLAGAGHLASLDRADEYTALLRDFVRAHA